MLMNFEIDNYVDKGVAIKVVGVGGGGGNAVKPDDCFRYAKRRSSFR